MRTSEIAVSMRLLDNLHFKYTAEEIARRLNNDLHHRQQFA